MRQKKYRSIQVWTGLFLLVLALMAGAALSTGAVLAGTPAGHAANAPSGKVTSGAAQSAANQSAGKSNQNQAKQSIAKTGPAGKGPVVKPSSPFVVLYDQLDSPGTNSTVSQNFETALDPYDSQLADDFIVSGAAWSVNEVDIAGVYFNGNPAPGGPARDFDVVVYSDASGLPGAVVATRANQAYVNTAGTFAITVATPISLVAGHYWLSVVANMDYGAPAAGEFGWTDRTVTANTGAAWQDPGGGFGACPSWTARPTCVANTGTEPDQEFRILGASGPTPTPCGSCTATPTNTPTNTACIPSGYTTTTGAATFISGTTSIGNACDDCTSPLTFPFPVSFYGATYTSANASSNGNIQFVGNSGYLGAACLPNANLNTAIMPYQDDLHTATATCSNFPSGCGIFTAQVGTQFIVEWRTGYFGRTGNADFEVIFTQGSSTISILYGGTLDNGASEVSGVQQGTGAAFTQFSCLTATLTNGLQVNYTYATGTCPSPTATNTAPPTNTFTPIPTATSTPTQICPGDWTQQTPVPAPLLDSAVVALNGKLYSFGGVVSGTTSANSYVYDPVLNTWTAIAPLPAAREWPSAVTDGQLIYIMNGADNAGVNSTTVYAYDPGSNTYSTLAPNTVATWAQTATYLNGKIYKIAGCGANCGSFVNNVEIYDIAANSWSVGANHPDSVGFLMSTAMGNFVYTAGGIGTAGESAKTYRYDPTTNTWDDPSIADLPATRWGSAEDNLKGKWLLAGGYSNNVVVNTVIAWNPTTNTWGPIDPMLNERARMGGATIGVQFFVVGGRDATGGFGGTNTNQRYFNICQPTPTNTATITGTPPTATNTRTRTNTPLPTNTPTVTATVPPCGPGANYFFTTSTGTIVPGTVDSGNHCDDCATAITLPFGFQLYDQTFTSAQVTSNGQLDFLTADASFSNTCLPDVAASYAIFPQWDDLYTVSLTACSGGTGPCGVFTSVSGSAPNRIFNIEWRDQYFPGTGAVNFEVRLYEAPGVSGAQPFDIIYGQVDQNGSGATVGVQKGNGSLFTQFECNTGGTSNGVLLHGEPLQCGAATFTPTSTNTPTATNTPPATCGPGSNYNVATSTATLVPGVTDSGNHCDDCLTTITLPFAYSLYDQTFNTAQASSNGQLDFLTGNASFSNTCLPDTIASYAIFPHWDDQRTDQVGSCATYGATGCGVFTTVTGSAPNRLFVIEWRAVYFGNTAQLVNYEVLLHEGQSTFDIVYGQVDQGGSSATVGVQRATGPQVTQYECNTAGTITTGLDLFFAQPPCGTPTPVPPTNTPVPSGIITGHLTWQGIPQPNSRNTLVTGTLTICTGSTPNNFTFHTDASGNFTVTTGLPDGGPNTWVIKGPRHLATRGSVTISGGVGNIGEAGLQKGGDVVTAGTNNNIVNASDFNVLKANFGQAGDRPSDIDFNGVTNAQDFNILKANFGQAGAALTCP